MTRLKSHKISTVSKVWNIQNFFKIKKGNEIESVRKFIMSFKIFSTLNFWKGKKKCTFAKKLQNKIFSKIKISEHF
jgi:hypothetical protein